MYIFTRKKHLQSSYPIQLNNSNKKELKAHKACFLPTAGASGDGFMLTNRREQDETDKLVMLKQRRY